VSGEEQQQQEQQGQQGQQGQQEQQGQQGQQEQLNRTDRTGGTDWTENGAERAPRCAGACPQPSVVGSARSACFVWPFLPSEPAPFLSRLPACV